MSLNICIVNKVSCNLFCRGKCKANPSLTGPSSASLVFWVLKQRYWKVTWVLKWAVSASISYIIYRCCDYPNSLCGNLKYFLLIYFLFTAMNTCLGLLGAQLLWTQWYVREWDLHAWTLVVIRELRWMLLVLRLVLLNDCGKQISNRLVHAAQSTAWSWVFSYSSYLNFPF